MRHCDAQASAASLKTLQQSHHQYGRSPQWLLSYLVAGLFSPFGRWIGDDIEDKWEFAEPNLEPEFNLLYCLRNVFLALEPHRKSNLVMPSIVGPTDRLKPSDNSEFRRRSILVGLGIHLDCMTPYSGGNETETKACSFLSLIVPLSWSYGTDLVARFWISCCLNGCAFPIISRSEAMLDNNVRRCRADPDDALFRGRSMFMSKGVNGFLDDQQPKSFCCLFLHWPVPPTSSLPIPHTLLFVLKALSLDYSSGSVRFLSRHGPRTRSVSFSSGVTCVRSLHPNK